MRITNIKYKANYYALLLLIFVIPLDRRLIAPLTFIFLITSLFNACYKIKEKRSILFFTIIYIAYCIGLLYSNNINYGIKDLTGKLALLIIPICFYISKIDFKTKLFNILKSFVDGCIIAIILALINSGIHYYFNSDSKYFFYNNIAVFAHPSYIAICINMALIIVYYLLLNKKTHPTLSFLMLFLFSVYTLLLASKTGLITMMLIHFIYISYWMIKHKKQLIGLGLIVFIIGAFIFTYKTSNFFKTRIDEVFTTSTTVNQESSTAVRSVIWNISFKLIKQQPFIGYGTGDVKDVLIENYSLSNHHYLAEKQFNAHNQFLQTTVALGVVGALILIGMLIVPLYLSIKHNKMLYLTFLLLILINFNTEAMLERQVGVIFYSVFNMLFFTVYFTKPSQKTN